MFGSKVKGQEEGRRVEYFIDQHGREYVANVEISTGHPCESLRPMFLAPLGPDWFTGMLVPPQKYLTMVGARDRARRGHNVEINYVQWLQDIDTRTDEFEQKLHDFVRAATQGAGNVVEAAKNPPPIIRDLIGAPPFPPRKLVEACAAGNKWALGLSGTVPAKAQEVLDEIRPFVVRAARKIGALPTVDPLAEDGDDEGDEFVSDLAAQQLQDPLDEALDDLEEQFDPDAKGGKREPVRRPPRAKAER